MKGMQFSYLRNMEPAFFFAFKKLLKWLFSDQNICIFNFVLIAID